VVQQVRNRNVKSRLLVRDAFVGNRRSQMGFPAAGMPGNHQPAFRFGSKFLSRVIDPVELFLTGGFLDFAFWIKLANVRRVSVPRLL